MWVYFVSKSYTWLELGLLIKVVVCYCATWGDFSLLCAGFRFEWVVWWMRVFITRLKSQPAHEGLEYLFQQLFYDILAKCIVFLPPRGLVPPMEFLIAPPGTTFQYSWIFWSLISGWFGLFAPTHFGLVVGTYKSLLLLCEWHGDCTCRWWGHLNTTCQNLFDLVALRSGGEQKTSSNCSHSLPLHPCAMPLCLCTLLTRVRGCKGTRVRGCNGMGTRVRGTRAWGWEGMREQGERVQGHDGTMVRGCKGKRAHRHEGARVRGQKGARVRGRGVRGHEDKSMRWYEDKRAQGWEGIRASCKIFLPITSLIMVWFSICLDH